MALHSEAKEDAILSLVSPPKPNKRKTDNVSLNPAKPRTPESKKRKVTTEKENGENHGHSKDLSLAASVRILLSLKSLCSPGDFRDNDFSPFGSDNSMGSSPQLAISRQNSPFPSPSLSQSSAPVDARFPGFSSSSPLVSSDDSSSVNSIVQVDEHSSDVSDRPLTFREEKGFFLVNKWLTEYEACICQLEAGNPQLVLDAIPTLVEMLRYLVHPGQDLPYWWCFMSAVHFLGNISDSRLLFL